MEKARIVILAALFFGMVEIFGQTRRFNHPAMLNNLEELKFIKGKIEAEESPWKEAFEKMRADSYASTGYTPKPRKVVACGYYDRPNNGCSDERNDGKAAYTHALMWILTGIEAHARTAVKIMNAWTILEDHSINGSTSGNNSVLQAGWAGELFPMAAEIIRYTYSGWSQQEIKAFSDMLNRAFVPRVTMVNGKYNNWVFTMIGAMMQIAVFQDDFELFDRALDLYRDRLPIYLYSVDDGPAPVEANRWNNANSFVDGMCMETCRDLGHTQMGFASILNVTEIAWHQGVDLYGEFSRRITTAMEFLADLLLNRNAPQGICRSGSVKYQIIYEQWEQGYNHYHNRMGMPLPFSKKVVDRIRPTGKDLFYLWETLTHAELGGRSTPFNTAVRMPRRENDQGSTVYFRNGEMVLRLPQSGRYEISLSNLTGKEMIPYQPVRADRSGLYSIPTGEIARGMYLVGIKKAGMGSAGQRSWLEKIVVP